MTIDEAGWDGPVSGNYRDGYEQGQADARNSRPYDDRVMFESPTWAEGYRGGYEDTLTPQQARRRAFRASLRNGASGE